MQALFNNLTRFGVALALTGGVVSSALYTVPGGHRAVIFDRINGVSQDVIGEGTHFLIPWIQKPIIYDIRTRPRNIPVNTGSKDLQKVNITLRILYKPQVDKLPKIYTNLGLDFEERVLPSITYEVLKSVVAQFDASDLITQRELVSQKVNEMLTSRAANFGLTLDDISLIWRIFNKPKVDLLRKIYRNLGMDFEERVLPSITYEMLKSVVAQFDMSDPITQCELVSQ